MTEVEEEVLGFLTEVKITILHFKSTQLSKIELKEKYKSFIKSTLVSKVLVLDMCNITEH